MTTLGKATVAAAVLASMISIADALYGGMTGRAAVWDDAGGLRWVVAVVGTVIAVTYALLAAVLVEAAGRIDGARRVVRGVRRLLIADLAVLAGVFTAAVVLDGFPGPLQMLAGVCFALVFLLGVALGSVLLPRPDLRVPACLLVSPLALLPLAALAESVADGWGHPGYAEAALYLGLALLGSGHTSPYPAEPTTQG